MHKVYKYPLSKSSVTSIVVPLESTVLSVGLQNDQWVVWILTNQDTTAVDVKKIEVIGTGQNIDVKGLNYINTFFEGTLVWHAFEIKSGGG